MSAIDRIIQQMEVAAQEKRAALKKERLAEIDSLYEQQKQQIEADHQQQLEAQLESLKKKFQQTRKRQDVELRQTSLRQKQQYLTLLFEAAYQKMTEWEHCQTREFAKAALQQLDLADKVLFQPANKADEEIYPAEWLAEINKKIPYQLELGAPLEKNDHGFIVNDHGIQYNFLYRSLLTEERVKNSNQLMKELFD